MGKKKTKAEASLIKASLDEELRQVIAMLEQFDVGASDAQGNAPAQRRWRCMRPARALT